MATRPFFSRAGAVLAALVLLGACSGGGDEPVAADADVAAAADGAQRVDDLEPAPPSGSDAAGDAVESQPAPVADPDGEAEDAPPPADGGSTDPTAPPSSEAPAPAAAPARPIVPRSGTYTYSRSTTDADGTTSDDSTDSVIERLSGDDSSGRVRQTSDSDQGSMTSEADVSAAGTLVDISIIDSPLGRITCDWNPDWYLNGAFVEGGTWTFDSACQDNKGTLQVDVAISGSGRVVGYEQIEVAGSTVIAWILETTTVIDFSVSSPTISGTQHSEGVSRSWVDPSLGLQVRQHTTSTSSGDFANGTGEQTLEFVRFTPA